MPVSHLDHVNIVTGRLSQMVAWYQSVLGLTVGPRPNFTFQGAWLYAGNKAAIHLVGHDGSERVGSEVELKLEHFAFSAHGQSEFEENLTQLNQSFESFEVEKAGCVQFHLRDPDGNHVHIDFPIEL